MLLIILVKGFCPLKIKILLLNLPLYSVLIHLIVSPNFLRVRGIIIVLVTFN